MKAIALAAFLTVATIPAPAHAQVYQQAQAGALAWCSARAAGRSVDQANQAFNAATVNVAGFGALFNMRAVNEQGAFLARQMCPESWGGGGQQRSSDAVFSESGADPTADAERGSTKLYRYGAY